MYGDEDMLRLPRSRLVNATDNLKGNLCIQINEFIDITNSDTQRRCVIDTAVVPIQYNVDV